MQKNEGTFKVIRPGVYSRTVNGIELRTWDTGIIIADRRVKMHISQEVLAEATGLNRSSISRYETGTAKKIPYDVLEKIARTLNCTIDYLQARTDDPHESLQYPDYDEQIERAMALYKRLSPDQKTAVETIMKSMVQEE